MSGGIIISNEDGEAIYITEDCLTAQCMALGLMGKSEQERALKSVALTAARLLEALDSLKQDKTDRKRQEAYRIAENAMKHVCRQILGAI